MHFALIVIWLWVQGLEWSTGRGTGSSSLIEPSSYLRYCIRGSVLNCTYIQTSAAAAEAEAEESFEPWSSQARRATFPDWSTE